MSDLDEELVLEFQVEAQEHLGTVEPALLEIEGSDAERRNELLHSIFRAVHSVKGASGFFWARPDPGTLAHDGKPVDAGSRW